MKTRNAFTLLEVILALGLTVVIVSSIAGAMRLYLLQLDRTREDIERRQISRGVLRMIDEDLRAALQYKPDDYSGLENLVESQSLSGIGGLATGVDGENIDADALEQEILDAVANGGGVGGEQAAMPAEEDSDTDDEDSEEEEESAEEQGRPTLIGDSNFIRIDTSRLPRLDEYNPLVTQRDEEASLPSDVKTITYFFSSSQPASDDFLDSSFGQNGGLYRRRIDRAVENFQSEEITINLTPDTYCELVAPEVTAIQFRYWDGEQWLAEWDSEEQSGFPSAIEVQVILDPERRLQNSSVEEVGQLDLESYRKVIHLPVAEIIEEEEEGAQ